MQIFQSPIWTPLGVIATIVLGFIGIYVTLWLRNRKALACEVVSNVPLVSVRHDLMDKEDAEDIEIHYHGRVVKDVRVVVVRVWNNGNVPIAESDFVKPLQLTFDGLLLTAAVTQSTPQELQNEALDKAATYPKDGASIVLLHPILLNPHDSVTIQAILSNSTGVLVPITRIIGVPEIQTTDPIQRALRQSKLVYGVMFGFAAIVGVLNWIGLFFFAPAQLNVGNVVYSGILLFSGVGGFIYIMWVTTWRAKRRAKTPTS